MLILQLAIFTKQKLPESFSNKTRFKDKVISMRNIEILDWKSQNAVQLYDAVMLSYGRHSAQLVSELYKNKSTKTMAAVLF